MLKKWRVTMVREIQGSAAGHCITISHRALLSLASGNFHSWDTMWCPQAGWLLENYIMAKYKVRMGTALT